MEIAGKKFRIRNVEGPTGVRGRNSDNKLIYDRLGWKPSQPLRNGMEITYHWIEQQIREVRRGIPIPQEDRLQQTIQ
jgi:GDP-D-mannose 3',5'-epimerase